jgi:hypothetical protein
MHNSHVQHSHRRRWQPSGLASRVAIHVPLWRRPTRSRLFQEPHQTWLLPRVHTAGGTQGLDSADRENWGTRPELALARARGQDLGQRGDWGFLLMLRAT